MIGEHVTKKLLEALLGSLQAPTVWVDIPDGHDDSSVIGSSRATGFDLRPTAKHSSCLVCCPLQVDEALGRAWVELDDVEAVNPQLRGDLDDTVPVRVS
jgi:hypothetical protein